MLNKTTSILFQRYGDIIGEQMTMQSENRLSKTVELTNKRSSFFYALDHDLYLTVTKGIAMIVTALNPDGNDMDRFVIHRTVRLKAGVYFCILSISANACIRISYDQSIKLSQYPTPGQQPIIYEAIVPSFQIKEIYAAYYQVRGRNYRFPGETHPYWELTFIDNGCLNTKVDDREYCLRDRELMLYAPNQFHDQANRADKACSYLTILFDMEIKDATIISNRIYHAHRELWEALQHYIKAADQHLHYDKELMLCYCKEIIIRILQYDGLKENHHTPTLMQQKFENELVNEIISYINEHIYEPLTIEDITQRFSLSRSSLQTLFKNNIGCAPKQYILDLKLTKSKYLIKESTHTISEIAAMLGFTSIHYFSRRFKQSFHMTPRDYAKSIYP